jgi:hypothetical protein
VTPPLPGPSARERVEKRLFERLARTPVDTGAPEPRRRRAAGLALASLAFGAAGAVAILTFVRAQDGSGAEATAARPAQRAPQRLTFEGAEVEVAVNSVVNLGDPRAEGTTLLLARGAIRCNVQPRAERPAFRVRAGAVEVVVVGTVFSVRREHGVVTVTVERGTVHVRGPSGTTTLTAGGMATFAEEGSAETIATDEPATGKQDLDPRQMAYRAAQALEALEPATAATHFGAIARGDDVWAALSLFSLAELQHRRRRFDEALAAATSYLDRFPSGAQVQDALWLRAEILHASGASARASGAADDYLRRFPDGAYAEPARRLLSPR